MGSSVIVDLSYSSWSEGYELARMHGIAYVRLERVMRPFLDMFGDFMRQKRANNVAMIFQNARDTMEAMKQLMAGYPFRTLILDASDTQSEDFVTRITSLRPPPTYYAMFARGSAMNGLFERVSSWPRTACSCNQLQSVLRIVAGGYGQAIPTTHRMALGLSGHQGSRFQVQATGGVCDTVYTERTCHLPFNADARSLLWKRIYGKPEM